jgi:hypothetical protein
VRGVLYPVRIYLLKGVDLDSKQWVTNSQSVTNRQSVNNSLSVS